MTSTKNAHGAVAVGPVRSGQRTAADKVADRVSAAVLLALGGFALAVSFSHTMQFVRDHGQHQGWVVVGTALTVVGLTVQSGLETYRDSRRGDDRGWPVVLLGVAVLAELYANASTAAGGSLNRGVAAWPVVVAAFALALWTRRLQHSAEAADRATEEESAASSSAAADPAAAAAVLEVDQEQEQPAAAADELAAAGTAKERGLRILATTPEVPGPSELGRLVGCSRQHAADIIAVWRSRPENQPGQESLDIPGTFAAAAA